MKIRNLFLMACTAAFALTSCGAKAPNNQLTEAEKSDGWQLLFDGETLDNWRDYNGEELTGPWFVQDGTIQAEGGGGDASGYIVTRDEYENFILKWDWKIADGGNSGVLYNVVENPKFSVPYVTAPEYQLIDAEGFDGELEDWQTTAANYAMHVADPAKTNVKPAGEWNTSKIVFDNGHVEHWLNGEKVVEFEAWTDDWHERKNSGKWADAPEYGLAKKGLICLQDHGSAAWFRNVKIKELPNETAQIELFNGEDLHGWEAYGTEKWYVEDGELICESGPDEQYGYLATRNYYNDFDFSVDFKQEADGNSGVFIRSFIEPVAKVNGWQVEVAPMGYGTGGIYESYGRGWIAQIDDEQQKVLKEGEWNTLRIRLEGDNIQTWLNGEDMINLTDEKIGNGQGRIALQIHDGGGIKVRWKNFKLNTL